MSGMCSAMLHKVQKVDYITARGRKLASSCSVTSSQFPASMEDNDSARFSSWMKTNMIASHRYILFNRCTKKDGPRIQSPRGPEYVSCLGQSRKNHRRQYEFIRRCFNSFQSVCWPRGSFLSISPTFSGFNHTLITSLNFGFDQLCSTSLPRELVMKSSAGSCHPIGGFTFPIFFFPGCFI